MRGDRWVEDMFFKALPFETWIDELRAGGALRHAHATQRNRRSRVQADALEATANAAEPANTAPAAPVYNDIARRVLSTNWLQTPMRKRRRRNIARMTNA